MNQDQEAHLTEDFFIQCIRFSQVHSIWHRKITLTQNSKGKSFFLNTWRRTSSMVQLQYFMRGSPITGFVLLCICPHGCRAVNSSSGFIHPAPNNCYTQYRKSKQKQNQDTSFWKKAHNVTLVYL